MTDEERSAWLSAMLTQNPSLSDRLERLLQEHRSLVEQRFLESPVTELPTVAAGSRKSRSNRETPVLIVAWLSLFDFRLRSVK
jgi:hypothetical protein